MGFDDTTLAGGLEHFLFCHILGIVIPTDELIFFRGVETTNQKKWCYPMVKQSLILTVNYPNSPVAFLPNFWTITSVTIMKVMIKVKGAQDGDRKSWNISILNREIVAWLHDTAIRVCITEIQCFSPASILQLVGGLEHFFSIYWEW